MTEPSKHKHARTEPAPKPARGARATAPRPDRRRTDSRFAWTRTTRGQAAIAVGVLAVVLLLWLLLSGGSNDKDPVGTDGLPGGYGTTWSAKGGASYRLTVTPVAEPVTDASRSQCIPVPGPKRANVRFSVRIDNLSSKEVPIPELSFGANVKKSGAILDSTDFDKLSTNIDLTPQPVRNCTQAAQVGPKSGPGIPEGGSVTFAGLIGGLSRPVGNGLVLITRYVEADPDAASGTRTGASTAIFGTFPQR